MRRAFACPQLDAVRRLLIVTMRPILELYLLSKRIVLFLKYLVQVNS
jgi:hypothetical protein